MSRVFIDWKSSLKIFSPPSETYIINSLYEKLRIRFCKRQSANDDECLAMTQMYRIATGKHFFEHLHAAICCDTVYRAWLVNSISIQTTFLEFFLAFKNLSSTVCINPSGDGVVLTYHRLFVTHKILQETIRYFLKIF